VRIRVLAVTVAGVLGVLLTVGAMLLGLAGSAMATTGDPTPTGSAPASASAGQSQQSSAPSSAAKAQEGITGTIRGPDGPLKDVKVTVFQNSAEIGSATTDDKGKWLVPVPKPGTYQVTLDVTTLPTGVQLRTQGAETIPAMVVQPNSTKFAIFPLVKEGEGSGAGGGSGGSGQLEYMISIFITGLRFGLIIAMTALGLSLIFGTTRLINFAHGELVTLGAVVAFIFGTSPFQWPFIVAILLAIVAVALLAGLLELTLWRPLRKRGSGLIQMFIISIGLSLLLRNGIQFFFGPNRKQLRQATAQQQLTWGPISATPQDLIIIAVSIAILVAVAVMLQRTRMGKAMRALADNRDLAEASGINVDRVILQVWVIGGGLAAVGGVLFGLTSAVSFDMGFRLLLLMFAGIILGGLGSAYGAMVGSIVVGLVAQYSTVWFPPELQNAWAMLVLVIVLLVRPQGILGRLQRAG
jgi:branched-chain amino acid transport system permease protein